MRYDAVSNDKIIYIAFLQLEVFRLNAKKRSDAMRYDAMGNDKINCITSVRGVQIKRKKAKRRDAI